MSRNAFPINELCRSLAVGLAILTATATAAHAESPTKPSLRFALLDTAGREYQLGQNDAGRARVFVFLGTECPVSNSYTPTLNKLVKQLAGDKQPVDFFGVVSDATVSRREAAEHFANFEARFPVLFDASGLLAALLKPSHVPEAFVVSPQGELVYRGAIDNAWGDLGRRRQQAEKTYLADALAATLAGKSVEPQWVEPVGCLFESPPEPDADAAITYARDIAPIIHSRCLNCHRAGQVAPFTLGSYEDVAKRAGQIVRVTQERIMPPWIPAPGDHKFVGERWLTDRELALLKAWAAGGRARGDAADLPPQPKFADGWRLGEPDLVVEMTKPFTVPADGPDILQNFVIPLPMPKDKLVAAVEFQPGNERVVHHVVLFLDESGTARKLDAATPEPGYSNFGGPGFLPSGALGGWSVGNTPRRLPDGMGRYLKRGSDLVMQVHYHPTGREEVDQSKLGIYFVDAPVEETLKKPAKLVGSIWLANYEMDIPAGEANYRRTTSYKLPRDVMMVGVVPHMHLLGKAMTVTATLPDGTEQTLIDIERWNYNWQDEYYFERPFTLPAGTELHVEAVFDNSEDNPSNPSYPPKRVTWGDGTEDEMLFCFFLITSQKTEDLLHVIFHNLWLDSLQSRKDVGATEGVNKGDGQ